MALDTLKIGTAWVEVEVAAEPDVTLTFRGYAPVLPVRVLRSGLLKQLYISAKSLAAPLETLREANGDRFEGLRLRLRKDGEESTSRYVLERL